MGWTNTGDSLQGPQGPVGPAGPSVWGGITGNLDDQVDLKARLDLKLDAARLTVSVTAPENPAIGDIWVDLS